MCHCLILLQGQPINILFIFFYCRWVEKLRYVGIQRQNSSSIAGLPPASSLPMPEDDSTTTYREPLPPIQLTPSSSRAHSPVPSIASLQLPPLDPSLYNQSPSYSRHHHHTSNGLRHHHHHPHDHVLDRDRDWDDRGRERYGSLGEGPAKDFDALTLGNGSMSSRYATSMTIREDTEGENGLSSNRAGPGGPRMDIDD